MAAAETTPTVSLRQLAATLAEKHEMPKKLAGAVLEDLVELVAEHLKNGDKVRITGLGIATPFELWNWEEEVDAPPGAMQVWRDVDITAEVEADGRTTSFERRVETSFKAEDIEALQEAGIPFTRPS